jgi:2-dehydropantoate 2-reductase
VVVGAGAMGCALGGHLQAAGAEVDLIDASPEVIDAIRRDGVIVETSEGDLAWRPRITDDPSTLESPDLLIVMVKGTVTPLAIRSASPLVADGTTVLSLQNGWGGGDAIAEVVPPEQIVIGVTYSSSTALAPGRYRQTGRGATFVGPYAGTAPLARAADVATALTDAGWAAEATPGVATEIWKKLILNAATLPTAALTGLSAGALGAGAVNPLVEDLAREAVAVAQAQGLDIQLGERLASIAGTLERAGEGKGSMLQDALAHRRTEIDTINGAVVRAGEAAGVPAPLNTAMVALVHGLESGWTQR